MSGVPIKAGARLKSAELVQAAPNQTAVVRALKQLGFHARKVSPDGDSIQIETTNENGEIFLTLNSKSLQMLKTLFAKDENLSLSFYTRGTVQVGVSAANEVE